MECIAPGQVLPEDLLAYLDGEAGAAVADHIARCAACAEQVAAYASLGRALRARMFRADCPAAQVLGDLAAGLLSPEETTLVRAHLALCPHCAGELAQLEAALRDDLQAAALPRPGGLARIVARLLEPSGQAAAFAGVRGAGDAPRVYEADGLTISLTTEAEGSGPARRWLLLALLIDEVGDAPVAGATLRLLHAGSVAAEATVDELGTATFEGLVAGEYDLELTLGDRLIVVEAIAVGASPM
jgi:anti-sigma factor RsiW